ncbi:MAG: acyltransferase [Kineosporiaceae bacterium]
MSRPTGDASVPGPREGTAGLVTRPRGTGADRPERAVGSRFAQLEGYRGFAALLVVVYHAYQHAEALGSGDVPAVGGAAYRLLHGLDAFVDLFFVLSAFLLALPWVRAALAGGDSPSGKAFLVRRAARLLPLYVVAVAVVWALRNPVLPGDLRDLAEHLTFVQVYDDRRIFWTIGPAWSLAVEVQFYVLLWLTGTGLCRLAARVPASWRAAVLVVPAVAVAAASLAGKLVAWQVLDVRGDRWSVWFGLPAKLDVFALGFLLAVVVATGRVRLSRAGAVSLALAGWGVVVATLLLRPGGNGEHAWFHTAAAVGFTLVLAGSVLAPAHEAAPSRWAPLSGPAPAFLATVSYSVYLWHEPLLLALVAHRLVPDAAGAHGFAWTTAVLVPVSVLAGWVSWLMIEKPTASLRTLVDSRGRSRQYYAEVTRSGR